MRKKIDKRALKIFGGAALALFALVALVLRFVFGVGTAGSGACSGPGGDGSDGSFSGSGAGSGGAGVSVMQSVPAGESEQMSGSKSEAYQSGSSRRGRHSIDEYFGALPTDDGDVSLVSEEVGGDAPKSEPTVAGGAGSAGAPGSSGGDAVSRVLGGPSPDAGSAAGGSGGSSSRHASAGSSSGSRSISAMTPEEKLEYDRKRAEMVRDVLVDSGAGGAGSAGAGDSGSSADGRTAAGDAAPAQPLDFSFSSSSDSVISSLDDDNPDMAVRYSDDAKRPFRCMFVHDEKIKSGQRVTVRLLEEYSLDGIRIPANTHLQAICKIDDRLRLSIRSLEMNGRIIPLQLEAYDSDGLAGIYCPEASKAAKTATNDLITTAGTSLGGLVGNIANTVIRTGATIAKSASGETSVTINSGYEFYLVKIEKR